MRFAYPITNNISIMFATPVLTSVIAGHEQLNPALKAQILAAIGSDHGVHVSNRGGWQSSADLWGWNTPEMVAYRHAVHDALLRMAALSTEEPDLSKVDIQYVAGAWANVNRHGAYNDIHVHPDCTWSCVYYVDCGEPEEGWERNGQFELHDPRTLAKSSKLGGYGFARNYLIDPTPGKLIMFPSWMEHSVHPFYGTGDRISIAANIRVTGGRHSGLE